MRTFATLINPEIRRFFEAGCFVLALAAVARADDAAPFFAGDRVLVSAKINQQQALFLFDTGATYSAIFRKSAERLGIATEATRETVIGNRPVTIGQSQQLDLEMLGQQAKLRLPILPFSTTGKIDGVSSHRNLSAPFLLIDGYERKVSTPKSLPETGWQRWRLDKDATQLFFEVTKDGQRFGRVFVDTGAIAGLRLPPPLWRAWREQNPNAGITLEAFRDGTGKVMMHEMSWADEYRLGDLSLRSVDIGPIPESQDDKAVDIAGKEFIATIGIRAFRQMRLLINRQNDQVLTRSVPVIPDHNRLGAVFVRGAGERSVYSARVLTGSPAERIGLKNGDVLLEINGFDFSTQRKDPVAEPAAFFSRPADTKLKLKVEREGSTHIHSA